jgi:hypothetical protein
MEPQPRIPFRLQRPAGPLPTRADFGFSADQTDAWSNIGNLSLLEAYTRFIEFPETYSEDFIWMGAEAFAYYFPVIDRYLREGSWEGPLDYCCAWILGCGVRSQFQWTDGRKPPPEVVQEIADLSAFVQANLGRFTEDTDEQQRILQSWREVDQEVAACRSE